MIPTGQAIERWFEITSSRVLIVADKKVTKREVYSTCPFITSQFKPSNFLVLSQNVLECESEIFVFILFSY